MKWEDYKKRELPTELFVNRVQTDIECPKCGRKVWKRNDIVLTSYPPKYQYECDCGWVGYDFK